MDKKLVRKKKSRSIDRRAIAKLWRERQDAICGPVRVKASEFIKPLSIKPGDRVVLCCRVSHCSQARKKNLLDQKANLRAIIEAQGGEIVAIVHQVGSGWDPSWLCKAARVARHADGILIAESVDRFLRSSRFHSKDRPNAQPNLMQFQELALCTKGCQLMTVVDPDATPEEVRSYQRQRGQRFKGKGGRPSPSVVSPMKKRRLRMLPQIKKLHERGVSVRQIARDVGLPYETIRRWVS